MDSRLRHLAIPTCRLWAYCGARVHWRAPRLDALLRLHYARVEHFERDVRRLSLSRRVDLHGGQDRPEPASAAALHAEAEAETAANARTAAALASALPLWTFRAPLRALDVDAALVPALVRRRPALPLPLAAAQERVYAYEQAWAEAVEAAGNVHFGDGTDEDTEEALPLLAHMLRRHGQRLREVAVRAPHSLRRMVMPRFEPLAELRAGEAGLVGEANDPLAAYVLLLLRLLSAHARGVEALELDTPVYAMLLHTLQLSNTAAAAEDDPGMKDVADDPIFDDDDDDDDDDLIGDEPPEFLLPPVPPPPRFPALRRLRVRIYPFTAPLLATSVLAEHITHLELTMMPGTGRLLRELRPLAARLSVLRLTLCANYSIDFADWAALGQFSRMTEFRVRRERTWEGVPARVFAPSLTDPVFEELLSRWPRLQVLDLPLSPQALVMTPRALLSLGGMCRELRELAISGLRCDIGVLESSLEQPATAHNASQPMLFPQLRLLRLWTIRNARRDERCVTNVLPFTVHGYAFRKKWATLLQSLLSSTRHSMRKSKLVFRDEDVKGYDAASFGNNNNANAKHLL
jgi:hypothetical protein